MSEKTGSADLCNNADALTEKSIRAHLERQDIRILALKETDSTNSEAKRDDGCGILLVTADSQSAGRGRLGRSFYSPADTGLYMTLALPGKSIAFDPVRLTCAASAAVCRVLERTAGVSPEIKWVNDLLLGGKKICGILCESVFDGSSSVPERIIIGIGININTRSFPSGLPAAASICKNIPRAFLAANITDELLKTAEGKKEWLEFYRSRSAVIGKNIVYYKGGEAFTAFAEGIDEDGGLIVRGENGDISVLRTGEITVRLCQPIP